MTAKLIVIEGIDGTGKRTQSQLLVENLRKISITAHLFGFPDYQGTVMGQTIGKMLAGTLGDLSHVHPYFSASLFALDRAEKRSQILNCLAQGEWVICDRYVYSNVAHQACRLPAEDRGEFLAWVEHLEYNVLGLPKPDEIILLSMEDHQSKTLRENRQEHSYSGSVLDVHESDLKGMSSAREIYEELAKALNWKVIECSNGGILKSIDEISKDILEHLKITIHDA
ncbi:dTMP kinase [Telluria sp. Tellsp104]